MKKITFSLSLIIIYLFSLNAFAQRIKDITDIAGIRENQLIGYGLVVGLPGTGEQGRYTTQSFATLLQNFGITLPKDKAAKISNVAAVSVHGVIPAFAKPGQKIDITISSIGDAKSLQGGSLLQTFLKGMDNQVYAVAQGSVLVGGFSQDANARGARLLAQSQTVARITNGAIVEREIKIPFMAEDFLVFNLHKADFSTANSIANKINLTLGTKVATPVDASSIKVFAPRDVSERVAYLSKIQNFDVDVAASKAKIVVNSRSGTIVIGQDVKLYPSAITHGDMSVEIKEPQEELADNATLPLTAKRDNSFIFEGGASLSELVDSINKIGASSADIIAILESLKQAGAIDGEILII